MLLTDEAEKTAYVDKAVNDKKIKETEKSDFTALLNKYIEKKKYAALLEGELPAKLEEYLADKPGLSTFEYVETFDKIRSFSDVTKVPEEFKAYYTALKNADADIRAKANDELPDEVKYYLASKKYYEGYYSSGKIYTEAADYEKLLTSIGISAGKFSADLKARLAKYVVLNGKADKFYGESISEFFTRQNVTDAKEKESLMKLIVMSASGIDFDPMHPDALLGLADDYKAEIMYEDELGQMYARAIGENIDAVTKKIEDGDSNNGYIADARNLEKWKVMRDFKANPSKYVSWRNSIVSKNYEQPVDDTEAGTAKPEADKKPKIEDTQELVEFEIISAADMENGMSFLDVSSESEQIYETDYKKFITTIKKKTVRKTNEKVEEGTPIALMLDMLADIDRERKLIRKYVDTDSTGANAVKSYIKNPAIDLNNHSDVKVEEYTSAVLTNYNDKISERSEAQTEVDGYYSSVISAQGRITTKGEVASVLERNRGDREALVAEVNAKNIELNNAEDVYLKAEQELSAERIKYAEIETQYITSLGTAAAKLSELKTAENNYEKAYAVWEYAYTPYLNKEAAGSDNSGIIYDAEGNKVDIAELDVPDAKEERERIEKIWTAKDKAYTDAVAKKAADVNAINADAEYQKVKNEYIDYVKLETRFARVEELAAEYTAKATKEYDDAKEAYETAMKTFRDKFKPGKDAEGKEIEQTESEKKILDAFIYGLLEDYEASKAKGRQEGWIPVKNKDKESLASYGYGEIFYWGGALGMLDLEAMKANGYTSLVIKTGYDPSLPGVYLSDLQEAKIKAAKAIW